MAMASAMCRHIYLHERHMRKFIVYASVLLAGAGACPAAMAEDAEMLARGKALFTGEAMPACAICHTLADAGSEGPIGPDLDELKPAKEVVLKVLHEGMGAMPSFAETMSEEDMEAVAEYVVKATGG